MTVAADGEDDLGVQNERTALAWRRTALACAAVGALVARGLGDRAGLGVLALSLLGAGATSLEADRRYRRRAMSLAGGGPVVAPRDVASIAVGVGVLAVAAVLAVIG